MSICSKGRGTQLTFEWPYVLVHLSLVLVHMTNMVGRVRTFVTFEISSILVDNLIMSWQIKFSVSAIGALVTLIRLLLHYHSYSWAWCSPGKVFQLKWEETQQTAVRNNTAVWKQTKSMCHTHCLLGALVKSHNLTALAALLLIIAPTYLCSGSHFPHVCFATAGGGGGSRINHIRKMMSHWSFPRNSPNLLPGLPALRSI